MVILPVLPSKLQLYPSHVRSLGHFIRSKWSKWINEIRKCDINIVNDLIVTYMIWSYCAASSWISRWHWPYSINPDLDGQDQTASRCDGSGNISVWGSEDDKMMECPVWCVPGWWLVTVNTRSPEARPSDTGDTCHAAKHYLCFRNPSRLQTPAACC